MKDKIMNVIGFIIIILVVLAIIFIIDFIAKSFCELRGGKYISGTQNSMCRFD